MVNLGESSVNEVVVKVFGEVVSVSPEDSVIETLREKAQAAGIKNVDITIDGSEIMSASDIPETFAGLTSVEVRRQATVA